MGGFLLRPGSIVSTKDSHATAISFITNKTSYPNKKKRCAPEAPQPRSFSLRAPAMQHFPVVAACLATLYKLGLVKSTAERRGALGATPHVHKEVLGPSKPRHHRM